MSTQVRNLTEAALLLSLTFLPAATRAKSSVDLNPNLDFTKYKTFAFIGGVEHLAHEAAYPPTEKDKEQVRSEHAKQAPKNQKPQFQ
jgi:hypothetical protein